MSILKFKKGRSAEIAQQLLSEAQINESKITEVLQNIAAQTETELKGLKEKFKTEKSLIRKLTDISEKYQIPLEKVARKINDTLRYTFILKAENYGDKYAEILNLLELKDYKTMKKFNAWLSEGLPDDTGYRGINLTVISSQKQKFEIQFHTVESFNLKTESHTLYAEFRNPQTSLKRKREITLKMLEKAAEMKRPRGI